MIKKPGGTDDLEHRIRTHVEFSRHREADDEIRRLRRRAALLAGPAILAMICTAAAAVFALSGNPNDHSRDGEKSLSTIVAAATFSIAVAFGALSAITRDTAAAIDSPESPRDWELRRRQLHGAITMYLPTWSPQPQAGPQNPMSIDIVDHTTAAAALLGIYELPLTAPAQPVRRY